MKKLSISLITLIFATPSFATGINAGAQSADCNNATLGTYTSPASLSANWTANTINLDFYDGETKLSSGQCTYDGGIVLPEDPTKEGYEFAGWRVRAAVVPVQPNCSEITDIKTCRNTPGCEYHSSYESVEGCVNLVLVENSSYTKCEDITDVNECLSIFRNGNDGYIDEVCRYYNGSCVFTYDGDGVFTYSGVPESWCPEYVRGSECIWQDNICVCFD